MVEFRKCCSNFMISCFNNLAVKNKFLLLKSSNLKFTDYINNKVNKANRNVGLIFRTFTFMDKEHL